jgi:hypothetical protein
MQRAQDDWNARRAQMKGSSDQQYQSSATAYIGKQIAWDAEQAELARQQAHARAAQAQAQARAQANAFSFLDVLGVAATAAVQAYNPNGGERYSPIVPNPPPFTTPAPTSPPLPGQVPLRDSCGRPLPNNYNSAC